MKQIINSITMKYWSERAKGFEAENAELKARLGTEKSQKAFAVENADLMIENAALKDELAEAECKQGFCFACGVAITAPQPATVPAGWKLVPVEPTEEMLKAAFKSVQYEIEDPYPGIGETIYKAMLEASNRES